MLYIARHGQTEYNRDGIYQGTLDSPLTERGEEQAIQIGDFLKNCDIHTIFHSPLGRTVATVNIISQSIDCKEIVEIPSFREMYFGTLQGNAKADMEQKYETFFANRTKNKYATPFPGGESYEDVQKRNLADVRRIITLPYEQSHLIVGHESVNRVIRGLALNAPSEEFVRWRQNNNQIVEVDICSNRQTVHALMPFYTEEPYQSKNQHQDWGDRGTDEEKEV